MYQNSRGLMLALLASLVLVFTVSCNSNAGSGGNVTPPLNNNIVTLGVAANKAAIYVTSPIFNVQRNFSTTGAVGIMTGTGNYSGTISFSVEHAENTQDLRNLPQIKTTPATCDLNSSTTTDSLCTVTIISNGASDGSYVVTPYITSNDVSQKLNKFIIKVGNSSSAGSIVQVLDSNNVVQGGNILSHIVLTNSSNVNNVIATISSSSTNVATVSQGSCNLSTNSNNCGFDINGLNIGTSQITIKSFNYKTINNIINVLKSNNIIKHGSLILSLNKYKVQVGETITATAKLEGDVLANSVVVDFSSSLPSDVSISPESCVITDPNVECSVNITALKISPAISINASTPDGLYHDTADVLSVNNLYAYVDNQTNGSVYKYLYNIDGSLTSLGIAKEVPELNSPGQMLVEPLGKYLYIINTNSNQLNVFSIMPDGDLRPTSTVDTQTSPVSMAIDSLGGYLYLTSGFSNSISLFLANKTPGVLTLGSIESAVSGSNPSGVAVGSDENGTEKVYVVNTSVNQIAIYSLDKLNNKLVLESTTSTNGLNQPEEIMINPLHNNIMYVVNHGLNDQGFATIATFKMVNNVLTFIGDTVAGNEPVSLAVSPLGNSMVLSGHNYITPYQIDLTGAVLTVGKQINDIHGYLSYCTIDPSGNYFYVNNISYNNIYIYKINDHGGLEFQSSDTPTGNSPVDIVFN